MSNNKKAVELIGLREQKRRYLGQQSEQDKVNAQGIGGDNITEPIPRYLSTPSEKIIEGINNSIIVMGRDRVGNRLTGYGGKGHTQCGSIDIVAGRMGYLSREANKNNELLYADPNFKQDASRIYLSQKTDIDDAFRLAPGSVGNVKTRSAIGLKADQIRIIAREGIKLVTKTDARNSQGAEIKEINGIDLIAGNDDSELQPMVKGENLIEAFNGLVDYVQKLVSIVDTLLTWQMKMNSVVATHTHISPFYGLQTSPSLQISAEAPNVMMNHMQGTKMGIMSMKTNLVAFKQNYLSQAGGKYINSRYNNTN